MSRDPEDVVFEAQYWKAALEDLMELSQQIVAAAEQLAPGMLSLVELAWSVKTDRERAALESVGATLSGAMENLGKFQAPVARLVDLAGGRVEVLMVERVLDTEEPAQ